MDAVVPSLSRTKSNRSSRRRDGDNDEHKEKDLLEGEGGRRGERDGSMRGQVGHKLGSMRTRPLDVRPDLATAIILLASSKCQTELQG